MHVLIVDDHPLFSAGLQLLLQQAPGVVQVVCAASGQEALQRLASPSIEVVLLDWVLGAQPSGAALIGLMHEARPSLRVVVVAAESPPERVREAVDAGAVGFVPKTATPEEMIEALSVTTRGGVYLPEALNGSPLGWRGEAAARVPARGSPQRPLQALAEVFPSLTPRQRDVLTWLVSGMSNKAIGRELGIAEGTVKQHANAVYRELGVDNRTEAVYLLARKGIKFL